MKCKSVLVGEATQATEPQTIVALCTAELHVRVAGIGDQMLLPPTAVDLAVTFAGLQASPFERRAETRGWEASCLCRVAGSRNKKKALPTNSCITRRRQATIEDRRQATEDNGRRRGEVRKVALGIVQV